MVREDAPIGAIARRSALSPRSVLWRAGRAAPDLRRPGGDRYRERAAVQGAGGPEPRADGVARAADGDRRDPAGDPQLADRRAAGRSTRSCRAPSSCATLLMSARLPVRRRAARFRRCDHNFSGTESARGCHGACTRRRPSRGTRRPPGDPGAGGVHVRDIEADSDRSIPRWPACSASERPRRADAAGGASRSAPSRCRARRARSRDKQIELLDDLRRPGRHRHRERAAVHGAAGEAGAHGSTRAGDRDARAADGHGGDPAGDRELADRPPAGVRRHGQSAVRLCDGLFAAMFRFDGELIHLPPSTISPPKASRRCAAHSRCAQPGPSGVGGRSSDARWSTSPTSRSIQSTHTKR